MTSKKQNNKKKIGIIAGAGILLLAILIGAFTVGFSEKEEVFPTFQDVGGSIVVEAGDYKLDKQPYLGDPNAPVKVVEFVDYKCPYCAAWTNNNLPKLKKDYIDTGKVQLYIVNFPFLGPDSIKAAMVGEILWKQNHEAFWEYTEALYAHQGEEKTIWANEKYLLKLIKKYVPHGDANAVKRSLEKLEGLYEVKEDIMITSKNGVSSVPTFVIGDQKYVNPDLTQLEQVINSSFAAATK